MRYDDIKKTEKGVKLHFHDDRTMVVVSLITVKDGPIVAGKIDIWATNFSSFVYTAV
ncbi:hypothetical protein R6Q59_028377 [Mikania micrantha]